MSKPSRLRLPPHLVALMMLQALEFNTTSFEGIHNPAIQKAIDWMVMVMFTDRSRLLEFLRQQTKETSVRQESSLFTEALLTAWTNNRMLKIATGRNRDEWLSLIK